MKVKELIQKLNKLSKEDKEFDVGVLSWDGVEEVIIDTFLEKENRKFFFKLY